MMWLLLLLLTGAELLVLAEDTDEINDGELSRKILGQSVVTSVSVVMDIGNGTKTIYSDPLGKPMDKPSSSSDLASPINLLNPDRYEFYTFDDNGNLVRRLMSLEEIKGIIATGDSDGLEYDSGFSESYIPEKRVNDVLSNVQNVLKEEMQIHNTKLDGFPALDTPDVSDSWNMILPAVFGNSGADITPEKPPLHITPDTIMIEPTERSQSTARSTPLTSSTSSPKVSWFTSISSYSTPLPTTASTATTEKPISSSKIPERITIITTESKEVGTNIDEVTEFSTKEYIPLSTISTPSKVDKTAITILETETTLKSTTSPTENQYVKIDPITTTTVTSKPSVTLNENEYIKINTVTSAVVTDAVEKVTKLPTTEKANFVTVTVPILSPNKIEINIVEDNATNLPELTMQSVESTINCTSDKNEIAATTVAPMLDDINSIDKIAAPEILNQLLSTPFVHDINTEFMRETMNQLLNNAHTEYSNETEQSTTEGSKYTDKYETTLIVKEAVTSSNDENKKSSLNTISSTETYLPTIRVPLLSASKNKNSTTNYFDQVEETSVVPTTVPILENTKGSYLTEKATSLSASTEKATNLPVSTEKATNLPVSTEKATNLPVSTEKATSVPASTEKVTSLPASTEKVTSLLTSSVSTETNIKPILEILNGAPIKSTKIEQENETVTTTVDYEERVKSTVGSQFTDFLNMTTIMIPLTFIDTSTISSNNQNEGTVRVPLIEPSESSKINLNTTNTVQPSINILINESQILNRFNEVVTDSSTTIASSTAVYNDSKNIVQEELNSIMPTIEIKTESTTKNQQTSLVTTEKPLESTEKVSIKTETPSSTVKLPTTTILTTKLTTESTVSTSKQTDSSKKETNWTLVPTIAPHSGSTFENPSPSLENYPEALAPSEPINLKTEPLIGFSLEDSTSTLDRDIYQFSLLYNELAFEFWKKTTNTLSHARSVIVSPFGAISLLAMIFLGVRGSTSAEMNEILKLDDMITFNPHLVLKNVGESIVAEEKGSGVVTSAIIRELFNDKGKGKILPFYKERVRAFYDGYVEEVNFTEIGDIIRRRTNLQVKKQSSGKLAEFLTDMSVVGRPPLLGLSVNIFQTDCSSTSSEGRDGEMHFTVLPSIRQRRLVPIPATLYKSGFLAGYEPSLDATAVSIGGKSNTVSTIFVMPGQQGMPAPGDGLARLEKSLVESSFKKGAWSRLLRSLIPRSGLEVQIPKISHRSVINSTLALTQMGFTELFTREKADLMGMNGVPNELYLSDVLQVNQFTTCGERRTDHHSEVYPSRAGRTQRHLTFLQNVDHFGRDLTANAFQDPLHDLSYLDLPLPLRPRQARKPDVPRLRFDRPFLYFVRHNPTGLILHIGRFNPRLLP